MDISKEYITMCRQADTYLPKHKWETGDFYAGNVHVCTNEQFWKSTQEAHQEAEHWKKVMHVRDNEINWGVVDDIGNPNYMVNCGHYEYSEIWPLYRQDQLQDLSSAFGISGMLYEFNDFVFGNQENKDNALRYSVRFKTVEQLWLGFIMEQNYEKHWNGSKWEKIKMDNNEIKNNERRR